MVDADLGQDGAAGNHMTFAGPWKRSNFSVLEVDLCFTQDLLVHFQPR